MKKLIALLLACVALPAFAGLYELTMVKRTCTRRRAA